MGRNIDWFVLQKLLRSDGASDLRDREPHPGRIYGHDSAVDRCGVRPDRAGKRARCVATQHHMNGFVGPHRGRGRLAVLVAARESRHQYHQRCQAIGRYWPRHFNPVASDVLLAGSFSLRGGCWDGGGICVFVFCSDAS